MNLTLKQGVPQYPRPAQLVPVLHLGAGLRRQLPRQLGEDHRFGEGFGAEDYFRRLIPGSAKVDTRAKEKAQSTQAEKTMLFHFMSFR